MAQNYFSLSGLILGSIQIFDEVVLGTNSVIE